jgi:hypothetical protein
MMQSTPGVHSLILLDRGLLSDCEFDGGGGGQWYHGLMYANELAMVEV